MASDEGSAPNSMYDVIRWAHLNDILPLPGKPGEKMVISAISSHAGLEVPEGMDPSKDTYHVPTPARVAFIRSYWRRIPQTFGVMDGSITLDTDYPEINSSSQIREGDVIVQEAGFNENVFVAAIDLDDPKFYQRFYEHPLMADWPVVCGKEGHGKAFVKVDYTGVDKPKNLVFIDPATGKLAMEILTNKKLAFIYGRHPDFTPENPVVYTFKRGFDLEHETLKKIPYAEFKRIYETVAADIGLIPKEDRIRPEAKISPIEFLRKEARKRDPKHISHKSLNELLGIRIEDVGMPHGQITRSGDEIIGSHPIHGSSSGKNYHINPSKGLWRCYSTGCGGGEGTGGDAIMFIAMEAGILDCSECHSGALDDPVKMKALIEELKRRGYDVPDKRQDYGELTPLIVPESVTNIPVAGDRSELPSIDELAASPPYIHLSASPRKGKTHRTIEYLMYGCTSGIYVTHTHATCGQAFRIAANMSREKLRNEDYKSVVWMAGKGRCCNNSAYNGLRTPCADCPLYPGEEGVPYESYEKKAEEMINEYLQLSPDIIKELAEGFCPYYLLKLAADYADVVITVPYFITSRKKESRIKPRKVLVIDEDTTIGSFYPNSIELVSMIRGASKSNFEHSMNHIKTRVDALKQVAMTNEMGEVKKKPRAEDKIIVQISGKIDEIYDRVNWVMEDPLNRNPLEAFNNIDMITRFDGVPITDEMKKSVIDKVEKYEHEMSGNINDDNTVTNLFEAILFNYEPTPLWWQGKGSGKSKLYLIGNEEKLIREVGLDPEIKQVIAIGFTRAEKFISDMQKVKPGESIKFDVKEFEYSKNFTMVKVCAPPNETFSLQDGSKRKDTKRSAKKMFYEILRHAHRNNRGDERLPSVILTSSEMRQDALTKKFDSCFIPLKKETLTEINNLSNLGMFLVAVLNSTFTRGIDVHMYDLIWCESTDYAMPYCDAVFEYSKETNNVLEMTRIANLKYSYVVDETTNAMLRPSPVRGHSEQQSKIIIIKEEDADKIHPKVAKNMNVVEIKDHAKIGDLWEIIALSCRKFGNSTSDARFEKFDGLSYQDARTEFDRFKVNPPSENKLVANARRKRQDAIDSYTIAYVKGSRQKGKDAIVKHVRNKIKFTKLRESEILARLNYLCVTGTLSSSPDPTTNKVYYRYIPRDEDIPDTQDQSYTRMLAEK